MTTAENLPLKLIAIGALGNMLSPAAKHLKNSQTAQFIRILDRGTQSAIHEERRRAWQDHNTQLAPDLSTLVGDGKFDGVVICAGKNGDDYKIFLELIPLLYSKQLNFRLSANERATGVSIVVNEDCDRICNNAENSSAKSISKVKQQPAYFILHLSTVSPAFVMATYAFCAKHNIQYANYPLTGGSKGAETAKMLILASGSSELYQRVHPFLQKIGAPKYFDEEITSAATVKLIGHVLVFHGLLGISLASLLHKNAFHLSTFTGATQTDFFDFLNNGAGGTKQWDVALRHGVANNKWSEGFLLRHAVVDLIYAITLMLEKNLPSTLLLPSLEVALLFTSILQRKENHNLATQAIFQLIATTTKSEVDGFIQEHLSLDSEKSLQKCIALLPTSIRQTIALEITYDIPNTNES
jgi:3-hydroxyisobutyrate dehydrogenase-like beta-hydroxyacid dehydrogenase